MSTLDTSETNETSDFGNNLSPSVGLIAKLRRIKIQEDLLIQNIKKKLCEFDSDFIRSDYECKKYITSLQTSYADIKQLLNDLKCVTKRQDTLQKLDIDEVRKDVQELDVKIKTFKTFLQKELAILKSTEQHLLKQESEEYYPIFLVKKHNAKLPNKTYSDIIPSPVKNIINSPLKYPEVQQFQDFLSHTSKHGGWNEYNHNIFIKLWQKHFLNEEDFDQEDVKDQIKRNLFIHDVFDTIDGVKKDDILSHIKWYTKYLYLKKRQQLAIEEWRAKTKPRKINRQSVAQPSTSLLLQDGRGGTSALSHSSSKCRKSISDPKSDEIRRGVDKSGNLECSLYKYDSIRDANEYLKEMERAHYSGTTRSDGELGFQYTKTTKQWINRCNSSADMQIHYTDLDSVQKLGIPSWRLKMMNNVD